MYWNSSEGTASSKSYRLVSVGGVEDEPEAEEEGAESILDRLHRRVQELEQQRAEIPVDSVKTQEEVQTELEQRKREVERLRAEGALRGVENANFVKYFSWVSVSLMFAYFVLAALSLASVLVGWVPTRMVMRYGASTLFQPGFNITQIEADGLGWERTWQMALLVPVVPFLAGLFRSLVLYLYFFRFEGFALKSLLKVPRYFRIQWGELAVTHSMLLYLLTAVVGSRQYLEPVVTAVGGFFTILLFAIAEYTHQWVRRLDLRISKSEYAHADEDQRRANARFTWALLALASALLLKDMLVLLVTVLRSPHTEHWPPVALYIVLMTALVVKQVMFQLRFVQYSHNIALHFLFNTVFITSMTILLLTLGFERNPQVH